MNDTMDEDVKKALDLKVSYHILLAMVLIKNKKDLDSFACDFYNRKNVLISLLNFRKHRLNTRKTMSEKEFIDKNNGVAIKDVFEELFLSSFSVYDMDIINKAINNKYISLHDIYLKFAKNQNENIMKSILCFNF